MRTRILAPLLMLLLAPLAQSAPHADATSARAAVLARFEAALHNDVAALDPLLAEDLDYCTFLGNCLTKAEYLADVKTGRVHYVSAEPAISKVKMFTDAAVASGTATVTVIRDGAQRTVHISWAAVLAWHAGRWQMTTWTSTLMDSASK